MGELFPFDRVADAQRIIQDAIAAHGPFAGVFACYSGGDDSLVSTHIAMQAVPDATVLHINTGIGIEATREHVRSVAADAGWRFIEERTPESYDDIVIEHGFPGPGQHGKMYVLLKQRAIDAVVRTAKRERRDRVLFIAGIRRGESKRRAEAPEHHREPGRSRVWASPLANWTKDDVLAYIAKHDLPRNPVSRALCMSGECLCGSFAKPGELAEIESVCPATARRIRDLEARVRAAGHAWGWEDSPARSKGTPGGPLCSGCVGRATKDMFADTTTTTTAAVAAKGA